MSFVVPMLCLQLQAQQGEQLDGIGSNNLPVPPSADVASLGQFTEYPVDISTGVASVNIPLWTLEENDVSLPVSLSYHASGVKVDQIASYVGMGWSLNAGGVISRVVKGLPDDCLNCEQVNIPALESEEYGWLVNRYGDFSNHYIVSRLPDQAEHLLDTVAGGAIPGQSPEYNMWAAIRTFFEGANGAASNHKLDAEPDVFFLNLPGRSLKFIIEEVDLITGPKIRVLGLENVKIELEQDPVTDRIESFKVTLEDGSIYLFDTPEQTVSKKILQRVQVNYNSDDWDDREVIFGSPAEFTKTFTSAWHLSKMISPTGAVVDFEYHNPIVTTTKHTPRYSRFACRGTGDCDFNMRPDSLDVQITENHVRMLKSIRSQTVEIDFNLSATDRLDLKGGRKLENIEVYAFPDLETTLIRRFTFTQEYRSSTCPPGVESEDCQRLFLTRVQECDATTSLCKPPHIFTYNTTTLPHRGSFEQDHWGYYKGNNATTFIPELHVYPALDIKYRIYPISGYSGDYVYLEGEDRSPTLSTARAGVLTKIQFPTGGDITYDYELNDYYDEIAGANYAGGGLRIRQSILHDAQDVANNIVKTYQYQKEGNPAQSSGVLIQLPQYARPVGFAPHPDKAWPWISVNEQGQQGLLIDHMIYSNRHNMDGIPATRSDWDLFTERFANSLATMGNLQGRVISYTDVTIDHHNNGSEIYSYHPPKNDHSHASLVQTSSIASPMGCGESNTILPHSNYSIGFIELSGTNVYPFPPLSDDSNFNYDKLKGIKTLDETGRLVKETSYRYTTVTASGGEKVIKGMIYANQFISHGPTSFYNPTALSCMGITSPKSYGVYAYHTNADALLEEVTETVYSTNPSSNDSITNSTYFTYQTGYKNPTSIRNYNVQGDKIIQKSKYAYDTFENSPPGTSASVRAMMNQDYRWTDILESGIYIQYNGSGPEYLLTGNVLGYDQGTSYDAGGTTITQVFPSEMYESQINIPVEITPGTNHYTHFEPRVFFNSYDAKGNVLEHEGKDGVLKAYLWGYEGQYLVAQIENASYAAVSALVNQTILDNPADDAALRTELDKLRAGLPNALITTYTYTPEVGLTSETDPNNRTSFFEYDTLGRLLLIRDHEGNILKTYEYRYAN